MTSSFFAASHAASSCIAHMGKQPHLNLYDQQLSYRVHAQCQKHQQELLSACACLQGCSCVLQGKASAFHTLVTKLYMNVCVACAPTGRHAQSKSSSTTTKRWCQRSFRSGQWHASVNLTQQDSVATLRQVDLPKKLHTYPKDHFVVMQQGFVVTALHGMQGYRQVLRLLVYLAVATVYSSQGT